MKYYSSFGPGPGFFPFWLGTLLAALSVAWVAQVTFRQAEPMKEGFIPSRAGKLSIVAVLLALVLVTWLMEIIGFRLTMLCFQLFLLVVLGRQNKVVAVLIALAGSFGVFYAFEHWLSIRLPYATLDFLKDLGL
jgi:putative tricarboxylic transport membrane protein